MEPSNTVFCENCNRPVRYHYDPVNHWKQLLLTIFTLGLWLPIWLSVTYGPTKLCDECGEPLWGDR
jgi:hypothetical protein